MQRFEDFVTLVNGAYKGLQKIKNYEMESIGLRGSHVMCMFYLGQNEEGLSSGELSRKCKEDKAAISRTLKHLYEKGFVEIASDENKKYRLKNVLTKEGKEIYSRIEDIVVEAENNFSRGVSSKDRQVFYKVMKIIVNNFENFCKEQGR